MCPAVPSGTECERTTWRACGTQVAGNGTCLPTFRPIRDEMEMCGGLIVVRTGAGRGEKGERRTENGERGKNRSPFSFPRSPFHPAA
jgi:hypothetical protein